ncbi:MAG: molybdopterin cofactor-binding domain-containing protein [Anaerolineales bacterium]|nr:molybdopterin cofactor-binding domain-containing protein [Anaerolineales bacterium]
MNIHLTLNGQPATLICEPHETLMAVLRRHGLWSVKHGCETGECGACSVLLDGRIAPTCVLLAAQAEGRSVVTVESLSPGHALHPIQQAFAENGAIQCGYCTPAMVLAAKMLLDRNPNPTEAEVREALGAVLCRCTGYVKPVEAVLRAAARLRGEHVPPIGEEAGLPLESVFGPLRASPEHEPPDRGSGTVLTKPKVVVFPTLDTQTTTDVVGKPEMKVDAAKLVKGKPVFTDDFQLPGMLHAALLTSPHAHARIKNIDTTQAKALPGVHAVLTYRDVPRVIYASGGQTWPNPKPWDQVSLDSKVRHVGDRVAVVAAETPEVAREALKLIEVEYEVLPAVFTPEEAMRPGAPVLHDEPDAVGIFDAQRNLAARLHTAVGDVERGLAESDYVFERTYTVHQVQQASIEPHVCITYWDEDDRLVIRTSTQVPFHVRRMIAPLLGLPVKRIRVIKPRIGGGFGGKQEMLIEDLCAHLTIATGRPVRFEYTREQEFTSARSRHPQTLTYRAGVMKDGTLRALDLHVVENTGAYATHGLTVCSVTGLRGLATYRCPNLRFNGDIVYTNIPVPGAFRGYGAPQAEFALECLMDEIAHEMGWDPVEFRLKNSLRVGDPIAITGALGEGKSAEVEPQIVQSCALPQCLEQAGAAIGWDRKQDPAWHIDPARPHIRRGLGVAVCMHGTAIPGLDMGAASIKLNDDGSFNVLVGATDLGTGSDTVLAQIAAETLGVPVSDIIIYSSDTDFTPFDTGAYASSTTFISGGAVKKAAELVRAQLFERAALMLDLPSPVGRGDGGEGWLLRDRRVYAPDGRSVSLGDIALHSLHTHDQRQIMATASHVSPHSPPPFAAQYAEIEVDTETGQITVTKLAMAVDCGTAINPLTAIGQIEGGMVQALGYAVSEEMAYDENGRLLTTRFGDYRIFQADEVPILIAILVPTYEPSGPFGAKAVAEIPMDGVAPAVANALFDAVGVRLRSLPFTPEKVWRAINRQSSVISL